MPRLSCGTEENGNWSSFQLANSAPPLSVTGSAIAPSARMLRFGKTLVHKIPAQLHTGARHLTKLNGIFLLAVGTSADTRLCQIWLAIVSGMNRAKIEEVTLNALRTRQSLVKGERLVRHGMGAVLPSAICIGVLSMQGKSQ